MFNRQVKKKQVLQNVLVSLFSERESHAVYFLQKQNLNRLDVVDYISHGLKKNNQFNYSLEEKRIICKTEVNSESFCRSNIVLI